MISLFCMFMCLLFLFSCFNVCNTCLLASSWTVLTPRERTSPTMAAWNRLISLTINGWSATPSRRACRAWSIRRTRCSGCRRRLTGAPSIVLNLFDCGYSLVNIQWVITALLGRWVILRNSAKTSNVLWEAGWIPRRSVLFGRTSRNKKNGYLVGFYRFKR